MVRDSPGRLAARAREGAEPSGRQEEERGAGLDEMREIRISVRTLVEFVLRQGDLDLRGGSGAEAMQEGARIHRRLQKAEGEDYRAEVSLRERIRIPVGEEEIPGTAQELASGEEAPLVLVLEGRADGIFPRQEGEETLWVIDEIKTTHQPLSSLSGPQEVHLAQARCYAWIYARQQGLSRVGVRMRYAMAQTAELRCFDEVLSFAELDRWFLALVLKYRPFALWRQAHERRRQDSIHRVEFPFAYRPGQRQLAAWVYQTIWHGRRLFLEAPTGTGKTLAVLFPAVKAMGEGKVSRIFYLTARNTGAQAPQSAAELLRGEGLCLVQVTLMARERVCALRPQPGEEAAEGFAPHCDPQSCPRAQGHFDRVNAALLDLLGQEGAVGAQELSACAKRHRVCPYQLSLDLCSFADLIIGDYNYAFDPHARLRRFFGEGAPREDLLFLVDEAHNLLERGRRMYSAQLSSRQLSQMAREQKGGRPAVARQAARCRRLLGALGKGLAQGDAPRTLSAEERDGALEKLDEALERLDEVIRESLEAEHRPGEGAQLSLPELDISEETAQGGSSDDFLEQFFALEHFLMIRPGVDDHYVVCVEKSRAQGTVLRLFAVDPGERLSRCMDRGVSAILFSATLLPIQYYKPLLGGRPEDYEVYARSSFDPQRLGIFLSRDVTSRYKDRSEGMYRRIAGQIADLMRARQGRYLAFFPSYAFLESVLRAYRELLQQEPDPLFAAQELLVQEEGMDERGRQAFLEAFRREGRGWQLGFGVLGGIFAEGIDLQGEALIGAFVVGTGLPGVDVLRDILRDYFRQRGQDGFAYAYRYPGMNRVLQAAGRVIRTASDVGIVALMDQRFLTGEYASLFPAEWSQRSVIDGQSARQAAEDFWARWPQEPSGGGDPRREERKEETGKKAKGEKSEEEISAEP